MKRAMVIVPALSLALGACKGEEPENHGSVKLELIRSAPSVDPFEGTDTMTVTLFYLPCLQDFYLTEQPDWAQEGVQGGPVWEDWEARLCDKSIMGDEILDCEVEQIRQNLGASGSQLNAKITYKVLDPVLDRKVVHFGPMPTEELAGCAPEVDVRATSVAGFDVGGAQIWEVESTQGFNIGETNQSGEITVTITRSN